MIPGIERYPQLQRNLEIALRKTPQHCCGRGKAQVLRKFSLKLKELQERDKLRKPR